MAKMGHTGLLELGIQHGMDLNVFDKKKKTPFHVVCAHLPQAEMLYVEGEAWRIGLFLRNGVDTDAKVGLLFMGLGGLCM